MLAAFGGARARSSRGGGGPGIVIEMVTAGSLAAFRALEKFGAGPIEEMAVHAADILHDTDIAAVA